MLLAKVWPRLALVAAVLLVWWAVAASGLVADYLLPSPGDVWRTLTANFFGDAGLFVAAQRSLLRLAFGMAAAVLIGTALGIGMAASPVVQRSVGTLMTGLQALPSIAWLPLAAVWLGLTERAVLFVVVIGAFPAIAIATAASLARSRRRCAGRGRSVQRMDPVSPRRPAGAVSATRGCRPGPSSRAPTAATDHRGGGAATSSARLARRRRSWRLSSS
jgi:ABC-type nitrate/sulfonate/bicarbonate transport system permease component